MKKLLFLSLLVALVAFACSKEEPPAEPAPAPAPEPAAEAAPEPEPPTATAELHNAEGEVVGTATFTQTAGGVVLVAEVEGVERAGAHGFHVHEVGDCAPPDFTSAGGHFNPKGTPHQCPPDPARHAGDFGNIEIVEGAGRLEVTSGLVTVEPSETSVVGRAVVLHEGTDTCVGQPTGDAGSRLACGVIKVNLFDAEDLAAESGDGGEAAAGDGG